MKLLNKLALALITALCFSTAIGENLSLDSCRQMALQNNMKIRAAHNAVGEAEELRKEAFTKYFPQVNASGFAFKSNKGIIQFGLLDMLTVSFLDKSVNAGITAVQPVFMGGQIVNGNRLAEIGVAVSELQRRQSGNDVIQTVDKYYWEITALQAKRETLMAAMTAVDSLCHDVAVALEAGLITSNDLLEAQLRRSELQADSVDLDNGINLCKMVLAQYIGADTSHVDIEYIPADSVPTIPLDVYMPPEQALADNPDYLLLKENVKAKKLEQRIELGKNLPTVGVGAGYFYQNALDTDHGYGAVFVAVNIPLSGWWGGSHAIKRTRLASKTAEIELEDMSELVVIGMEKAWDDLTAAQRKADIAHKAIATATENLRLYNVFYQAGTATITDLLAAQALHRQTLDRFTEANAAYQVALTQYRIATSQIN